MRLWSLHPKYLDRQGLLACWREGLLALSVARRGFSGAYSKHPQLERFRKAKDPESAFLQFLDEVAAEMKARNYRPKEIPTPKHRQKIAVTKGQLGFEFSRLQEKLRKRSNAKFLENWRIVARENALKTNAVFSTVAGPKESWEKSPAAGKTFILADSKGSLTRMKNARVKVKLLKPHEKTDKKNLKKIHAEVAKAGAVYPLLVDRKTLVVLDGHHRLASLRKLKVEMAPVILVDYFGKDVKVGSWKKGKKVTKEEVIRRGLAGKLFSPKTSKHTHKFKAKKPAKLIISRK